MKYVIFIYADEEAWKSASRDDRARMMDAHRSFAAKVPELGATLLGGDALMDSPSATIIRDGNVTDGPFVESKEALGGYYLIEAPTREIAVEVARHCPVSKGAVELRPVWDTSNI
jgi:hypothetical protein